MAMPYLHRKEDLQKTVTFIKITGLAVKSANKKKKKKYVET